MGHWVHERTTAMKKAPKDLSPRYNVAVDIKKDVVQYLTYRLDQYAERE